uniref:AAA-ATPase Vps4-associated protein 1 n=1 Tax=Podoviridae sp. cttxo15 TaxID=2826584 RepID=A0A8S5N2G9_9CAUD|nr:MAG TPA: AAA-ATPase Vps4-associated protein 1 [Podoviridae sp. cttxo15]
MRCRYKYRRQTSILDRGIFRYAKNSEKKENLTDKIRTDQKTGSDFFYLCETFGSR